MVFLLFVGVVGGSGGVVGVLLVLGVAVGGVLFGVALFFLWFFCVLIVGFFLSLLYGFVLLVLLSVVCVGSGSGFVAFVGAIGCCS